jgi:ornithine cyclodeaminase/alanine dehydrogenase-like protein (mu-crystallin family)
MTHAPNPILCLDAGVVAAVADRAQLIEALAEGFQALTRGEVQAPPRPKVEAAGKGLTLAMLAWAPGRLITQKTVSVYHQNHDVGLASHQALISLYAEETGVPVALLDGGSVTALRTTGAAVLSIRMLARRDARVATVVGAGVQGEEHVRQLGLVRDFAEIRVWSRNRENARRIASLPRAVAVDDLEAAVRSSDVVCLTTAAATPVIKAGWVRPGTHVTSVGYTPPGSEVPDDLFKCAQIFVEAPSAFEPAPVGCVELAGRGYTGAALGEVLVGAKPGRASDAAITLYKSMGNGMEDMVAANLIYRAAVARGLGQIIRI